MDAHDRAVDHLHLAVVRLDDGIHQAILNTCLAPAVEAMVGARVGPISRRQIAPRRARAQHPEDTVENAAVVARLAVATVLGQKRFDNAPLEIGQAVAHDPSSDVSQLESLFAPIRSEKFEYTA
jgi:hypothetical protein